MVDFSLKSFSFSYPCSEKKALKNIDLDIRPAAFVVISAKSGSGKSTHLRMLKPEITPHGQSHG